MSGKFTVKKDRGGQFVFNLQASNGRIILASERYKTKRSALNGIKSIQKNAGNDKRYDRRTGKNGKLMFCLCAANGEVIGTSQMYAGHSGRNGGIASVKKNAPGASIDDQT